MPPPSKSRFRRFCRVAWRIARTSLVVLVIFLGTLMLWLTEVGLPDFVKQRLVSEMRSRGVEFQFSRIRLRWRRGVVAEQVNFGKAKEQIGPQFFAEKAELHLDQSALKHFQFVPAAMTLKQGRLVLPLQSQEPSLQSFSFDNITAELLFQSGDRWELKNLQARALGVTIQLAGTLANASFVRRWQWPQSAEEKVRATDFWFQLVRQLEKIKWSGRVELTGGIKGDARDFNSFAADLRLSAPALESPWVSANHLLLSLLWSPPPASNDLPRVEIKLNADHLKSPWGEAGLARFHSDLRPLFGQRWLTNLAKDGAAESAFEPSLRSPGLASGKMALTLQAPQFSQGRAENLQVDANFKLSAADTNLIETELAVSAQQLQTDWGAATNAAILAHVSHAWTNLVPLTATGQMEVARGRTTWGNARRAQVDFAIKKIGAPPAWKANSIEEWLTLLDAFTLDWETRLSQAEAPKLQIENLSSQGQWRAPHLLVPKLHADLYGGEVAASARLDTATRELTVNGNSTFDVRKIIPLLSTNTQAFLADYTWEKVSKLEAQLRLILPAWTNRHPDWSAEVGPTMQVQGNFQVLGGAFCGLPFTSAQSSFSFSNLVWRLPDLQASRPEGTLHLSHVADKQAKNFHWLVRGRINPKALKPFLKTDEQKQVLEDFEFTEPPTVEAEIWGRSNDALQLGVTGAVHARNFSFRRQAVVDFTAAAQFTNQFLRATGVQIQRAEGNATVERIGFDLANKKLYITNAVSGLDKDAVVAGLGEKAGKTLAPYKFSAAPTVRINGTFDLMKGRSLNDARFEVNGGPFQWVEFRCPRIHGQVHWLGDDVTLTNVVAEFYGGQIAGHAFFDATTARGTRFSFLAMVAEVNLHTLMADISSRTNKLEGTLDGELAIDSANTDDPKSWRGHGRVNLRDGLIWEFPIFGIFSPALNAVSPGLGNSRARHGSATFTIKDGAVQSKDLQLQASGARLDYSGSVDFDTKVRGKMEAELFRNVPLVGKVMSLMLWPVTKIFEYKISGTLAQPKAEPVYVPGFLVHPFRSIKGIFPEEPKPPPEK